MSNAIYDKFKSDYKGQAFDTKQDEYTFGEQYERRLELKKRTGVAINELEGEINKRQFISYTSLAQLTLLDSDLTLGDESLSLGLIISRMINLSYLIVEVEQDTNLSSVCGNKIGLLLIERYNDNLTTLEFISSDNLNIYKGISINSIWSNWEEEINRTKLDNEILTINNTINSVDTKLDNEISKINNSIDTKLDKTATSINSLALSGKTRDEFESDINTKLDNEGTAINSLKLEGKSKAELTSDIISSITGDSPDDLNTLNGLSNAINNDPNFSTTIDNLLAEKENKIDLNSKIDALDVYTESLKSDLNNEKNEILVDVNNVIDEGNSQLDLLTTANEGYVRSVEEDQETVLTLTEQLMLNLNEDYVTDRTIINAQTARSIELIKQATNEAIEVIRKIKEGL